MGKSQKEFIRRGATNSCIDLISKEIDELEIEDFNSRPSKLVIVKHGENNFSIFLVEDKENPKIPGYPAYSFYPRYKSGEEAQSVIRTTYQRLNYFPRYMDGWLPHPTDRNSK